MQEWVNLGPEVPVVCLEKVISQGDGSESCTDMLIWSFFGNRCINGTFEL